MTTYEVYTERYSKIIQAENILECVETFLKRYNNDKIIGITDNSYDINKEPINFIDAIEDKLKVYILIDTDKKPCDCIWSIHTTMEEAKKEAKRCGEESFDSLESALIITGTLRGSLIHSFRV